MNNKKYNSLIEILQTSARKYFLKEFIVAPNERLMFCQVLSRVRKLAHVMVNVWSVREGDRVVLQLKNSSEFIVVYFAILQAGAIPVPFGVYLSKDEMTYIVNDCTPALAVTSNDFLDRWDGVIIESAINDLNVVSVDKESPKETILLHMDGAKAYARDTGRDWDRVAVIIYTSGTTGHPKGVMLSHGNLISNVVSSLERINYNSRDRIIGILPFYHSFAFTVCVLIPLFIGAKIFIRASLNPFHKTIWWMVNNRITVFAGIPKMFYLMSRMKVPAWFLYLNSLRMAVSGASPLDEETLTNFENVIKTPLLEGYGLSEASPVVSVNPLYGKRKIKSVGPPLKGVKVKVVDHEEKELGVDEVGELIVKGDNVMLGYYNRPEDTKSTIKNEWLFTGDLAKIDDEGYIFIVDRKKDLIIVNGLNIYPREVEVVLETHPKIQEVAVVKGLTAGYSEYPIAVIVLKKGAEASADEFSRYCQQRLAPFKIPRRYYFRDDLPKTPTGKILKKDIVIDQAE